METIVDDAAPPSAPAVATVVGGAAPLREQIRAQLSEAGFMPSEGPGALIVVLDGVSDQARLRDLRLAAEAFPEWLVLAVLPHDAPRASLRRVLLTGATAIVLDRDLDRALVPTINAMLAGQLAVPVSLGRQIAPRPLSHREKQILSLVIRGCTNREIAHKLFLAESTVKTHLSSSFRKLDAGSRSEAVERIMDPENGYGTVILELGDAAA